MFQNFFGYLKSRTVFWDSVLTQRLGEICLFYRPLFFFILGTKHSKKFEKEKMNQKEKSTGCKKQTNKFDLQKSIQTLFLTSNAACFSDLIGFENLLNSLHDLKKLRSPIVQA